MEDSKNQLDCPLKDECVLMGCDGKEGTETEGTEWADVEHTAHLTQGNGARLETRSVSQRRRRNIRASKLGLYCVRPQILDIGVYMYSETQWGAIQQWNEII